MPLIGFPSWWNAVHERGKLAEVYRVVASAVRDWESIKRAIKLDIRPYYIGPYRGDPVAFSYAGLVLGILEKARSDPVLLFPSIASETLDEEAFDERAAELEELVERAIELDFTGLEGVDLFDPELRLRDFHPMLVDACGVAVGNLLLKSCLGERVLEKCVEGDKEYARYLADWGSELGRRYREAAELTARVLTDVEDLDEMVQAKAAETVTGEVIDIAAHSLEKLGDVMVTIRVGRPRVCEGVRMSELEVKTIREESSEKLLKSAVQRLRRL